MSEIQINKYILRALTEYILQNHKNRNTKNILLTCTPNMPNIIKNVQHISTILPMGLRDDKSVCTTNFKPGALFITLRGLKDRNSLNT